MSSHVYHEIFLHLNWHTKCDHPTLTGDVEAQTHRFIREKCGAMKGVTLYELGGTDTHAHLALQVEPFVKPSEMIQEIKGASAYNVNRVSARKILQWQRGYGIVSFGMAHLPWIRDYVRRQREHHDNRTTHPRLEAHDDPNDPESTDDSDEPESPADP